VCAQHHATAMTAAELAEAVAAGSKVLVRLELHQTTSWSGNITGAAVSAVSTAAVDVIHLVAAAGPRSCRVGHLWESLGCHHEGKDHHMVSLGCF
jgi:hypothetical protein